MESNKTLNSIKHGLLAKTVILQPEDQRPFNKLTKRLIAELNPETGLEMMLAEQVIVSYWRLQRFIKLENDIIEYASSPKYSYDDRGSTQLFADFLYKDNSLDLVSRYNATLSRGFYRALHEFQNLKQANNSNKTAKVSD